MMSSEMKVWINMKALDLKMKSCISFDSESIRKLRGLIGLYIYIYITENIKEANNCCSGLAKKNFHIECSIKPECCILP